MDGHGPRTTDHGPRTTVGVLVTQVEKNGLSPRVSEDVGIAYRGIQAQVLPFALAERRCLASGTRRLDRRVVVPCTSKPSDASDGPRREEGESFLLLDARVGLGPWTGHPCGLRVKQRRGEPSIKRRKEVVHAQPWDLDVKTIDNESPQELLQGRACRLGATDSRLKQLLEHMASFERRFVEGGLVVDSALVRMGFGGIGPQNDLKPLEPGGRVWT
ncbi:hypothetical protein E4U53_000072 [Claviceps sorghi]|nr:hypothetical protein E4U53_000072 [Claviceps sorghi]